MSLEIRLLSYKGNGTQGERIVRTTFRGKIESTVCYTRHITALILDISINERVLTEKKRLDLNMYLAEKNMKNPQPFFRQNKLIIFSYLDFRTSLFFSAISIWLKNHENSFVFS